MAPYSGAAAGAAPAQALSTAPVVMQLPAASPALRTLQPTAATAAAASGVPAAAAAAAETAKGKAQGTPPVGAPRREPVRLRWWLVTMATLVLIWLYARPDSARKIEQRIEAAKTAGAQCRLNDAQSELIALRMTKATPAQLKQLQYSIDIASQLCGKKITRDAAWRDAEMNIESAMAGGDFAKAQSMLSKFSKRWNDDAATRKMKARISERRAAATPAPAPLPLPQVVERPRPLQSVSARNLIDEADRALKAGDYRAAVDKLETCITMVDGGAPECAAFKVHADRLLRDRERCVASGRIWGADRCN
jgi:hypothetical protein